MKRPFLLLVRVYLEAGCLIYLHVCMCRCVPGLSGGRLISLCKLIDDPILAKGLCWHSRIAYHQCCLVGCAKVQSCICLLVIVVLVHVQHIACQHAVLQVYSYSLFK